MKPNKPFTIKMSIQSLFDQRKAFEFLTDVFDGRCKLSQVYCNGWIHNLLKQFHQSTETFCTSEEDNLAVPKSGLFGRVAGRDITEEELQSLSKHDMNEFYYPYKRVSGKYQHLTQIKDKETVESLFDMISMFIMCGQRPHHIEADISRNIHAFGIDGHFPKDLEILSNWCEALITIDQHLETHYTLSKRSHRDAFSE